MIIILAIPSHDFDVDYRNSHGKSTLAGIIYFQATGDAARYKCSSSLSVCVFAYAMCVASIADGQHDGGGLA